MERTTVGSLLRTTQALCTQLCEKQTLEHGIVYCCTQFPHVPEVNQYREVIVDDESLMPDAFRAMEDGFARRGLFCYRWAPAANELAAHQRAFLKNRGFASVSWSAMRLVRWPEARANSSVRIMPARALRAAYLETFSPAGTNGGGLGKSLARAYNERLDDPQFDAFVALVDKEPAGHCALFQVGDIARVMDLCVLPAYLESNVHRELLGHVLKMARRLEMTNVCAQVRAEETRLIEWLGEVGFVEDDRIEEFERTRPDNTKEKP